jgi:hypothetical protein
MDVQIETSCGIETFALDQPKGRWRCARTLPEADFPLIRVVNGKRCELYSDGTFAEVELGARGRARDA